MKPQLGVVSDYVQSEANLQIGDCGAQTIIMIIPTANLEIGCRDDVVRDYVKQ